MLDSIEGTTIDRPPQQVLLCPALNTPFIQVLLREEFARQTEALRLMAVRADGGGMGPLGAKDRARLELDRIRQRMNDTNSYIQAALGSPGRDGSGGGGGGAAGGSKDSLDHFVVSTHLVPRRCAEWLLECGVIEWGCLN